MGQGVLLLLCLAGYDLWILFDINAEKMDKKSRKIHGDVEDEALSIGVTPFATEEIMRLAAQR